MSFFTLQISPVVLPLTDQRYATMDSLEVSLVKLSVLLSAAYILGHLFRLAKTSSILGHIVAGAILGPGLLSFAPVPAALALAGVLGALLWTVGYGLTTNLSALHHLAPRALLIALLGILFPLGGGIGTICATHAIERSFEVKQTLRVGFAVGSALTSSSIGVAAGLLAQNGEANSEVGTLIMIATLFNDVITIVLFEEVQVTAAATITAWPILRPVVFALAFIVGAVVAVHFLPVGLEALVPITPIPDGAKWRLGLAFVFAAAILGTYAAVSAGTSIFLAGFLVGVAFADASERDFTKPWADHVGKNIDWLLLLFFTASIGFSVPVRALFRPDVLALGAVLAFVGTAGKLLCGLGARNTTDGVAVGVTMMGRGGFGFLIAGNALKSGILSERIYSATAWGILVPMLLTPALFGVVFRWRGRKLYDETVEFSHKSKSSVGERISPGSELKDEFGSVLKDEDKAEV